jgi:hypothetical protein
MRLKALLFPAPVRSFPGQRWVRISIRTVHLLSMALLLGGFAVGIPLERLPGPLWWTLLSGVAFVGVELHASCIFLLQLKGIAVIAKSLLLWAAWLAPQAALGCMIAAVVIGGVSSHMPGKFRYFSPLHGRVIKQ